ncbi:MAG: tRNA-specific adenosine deaminase [Chlamydiae bacterium]|nr:tRNA-specific adenosine deaminase [Chlamydiota bacterium]
MEAKIAQTKNEVPVGAVLVVDGKIIARAHNTVEAESDASRHAELLCLQKGAEVLENWRLVGTTLYCTLEPCAMCSGALALFRVGRLVYGAPDLRHGANGSVFDVLNKSHPIHQVEVCGGVCALEAKELLQNFFRERRAHVRGIV